MMPRARRNIENGPHGVDQWNYNEHPNMAIEIEMLG